MKLTWQGQFCLWGPFEVGEVKSFGPAGWRGYAGGHHDQQVLFYPDEQTAKEAVEQQATSIIAALLENER